MRFNNMVIGIAAILSGAFIFIYSQSFPDLGDGRPGASLFPMILSALLVIVGLVQIPSGVKNAKNGETLVTRLPEFNLHGFCNFLVVVMCVLFYIYASDFLGFIITSFLIMFVLTLTLRARVAVSIAVSLGATLCVYLMFNKMLMVPLPVGLFSF
ncbi:permease [Synergistales bacterium]|nr:permease [Synergistales bacterium]